MRRHLVLAVSITLAWPVRSGAQEVAYLELEAPDRTSAVEFTNIIGIRELSDGTVLLADRSEGRLAHLTWDSSETIGRQGNGPGEYRGVGSLFPLPDDSTLFVDRFHGRWNVLNGTRITETVSEHRPVNQLIRGNVFGSDGRRVLGIAPVVETKQGRGSPDSLVLVLADRLTGASDTVARLKGLGNSGSGVFKSPRGGHNIIVGENPLATSDQALLFTDGWIAVVKASPYRVRWLNEEGQWVEGNPLPFEPIAVDEEEKCIAVQRFFGGTVNCGELDLEGWPERVPPFIPRQTPGLFASPEGHVVIARVQTADQSKNLYDIVDRTGRMVAGLILPKDEQLIGFGRRHAFTLKTDEWDLQTLRRHPWKVREVR